MYNNLQQVLILAANGNDYEDNLKKILEFYNNEKSHDFNEDCLRTHLRIFSTNFPKKYCANFEDILMHFKAMAPSSRKMISEVSKIFELILVLPATNATSERTFSKLKLLKTYLRATMTQKRLNHLMICSIYPEHLDDIDIEDLSKQFVLRNAKRETMFQIPK